MSGTAGGEVLPCDEEEAGSGEDFASETCVELLGLALKSKVSLVNMGIRKWQLLSMIIIGILVFLWSIPASDNSIRGIYDGTSKSEVLARFSPLTWILYSAQEVKTNQFDVELSPVAYLVFALFWSLFDGISIILFNWIPTSFARPRGWFRASAGIVLSIIFVPLFFGVIISLLGGLETFQMFTDFGVHRSGGFGIDLSSAIGNMFRVPLWTILLSLPNIILLIICVVKGKDSWLMRPALSR